MPHDVRQQIDHRQTRVRRRESVAMLTLQVAKGTNAVDVECRSGGVGRRCAFGQTLPIDEVIDRVRSRRDAANAEERKFLTSSLKLCLLDAGRFDEVLDHPISKALLYRPEAGADRR